MRQITVAGGNLFQLAAQYLGDPTQWIRIAIQNGLSDPFLHPPPAHPILLPNGRFETDINGNVIIVPATITLTIPDVDPNAGGGLPPQ